VYGVGLQAAGIGSRDIDDVGCRRSVDFRLSLFVFMFWRVGGKWRQATYIFWSS
jgi:hypothetical protein